MVLSQKQPASDHAHAATFQTAAPCRSNRLPRARRPAPAHLTHDRQAAVSSIGRGSRHQRRFSWGSKMRTNQSAWSWPTRSGSGRSWKPPVSRSARRGRGPPKARCGGRAPGALAAERIALGPGPGRHPARAVLADSRSGNGCCALSTRSQKERGGTAPVLVIRAAAALVTGRPAPSEPAAATGRSR